MESFSTINSFMVSEWGRLMRVIAVTGMPGSGKGEVAATAKGMGLKVYSMGDVVRSFFSIHCPGRDPIETGLYADMERKKHGEGIWARRLVQTVENELEPEDETILIDGLRSSFEAGFFNDQWGDDFLVMAVHSSPDTRFRRLSERGRGDDSKDRSKFDQRDQRELKWGLGHVISMADIMMVNECAIGEFRSAVREFLMIGKVRP
jgi:dephospho-CoA kinase